MNIKVVGIDLAKHYFQASVLTVLSTYVTRMTKGYKVSSNLNFGQN
jgi:hypothetical protein